MKLVQKKKSAWIYMRRRNNGSVRNKVADSEGAACCVEHFSLQLIEVEKQTTSCVFGFLIINHNILVSDKNKANGLNNFQSHKG